MTRGDLETRAVRSLHGCDDRDEQLAAGYVPRAERSVLSIKTGEPVVPNASASSARLLRFVPIGDYLTQVTAPKWLIRDIVEQDSTLLIFGDPEVGKSFLAMDWAASVATGRAWHGFKVQQGPVLYINGEGHNGVNRRFTAWSIARQTNLAQAPLYVSSTTTALTDEMSRAELEAVIAAFIADHGPPVLIVIDTLARNYGPGDENSTQDMTQAIATCDAIREMTRAVVALVHHSGHADKARARGSMVLKAALDAEYRMTRIEDSKDTVLECVKMKDAEKPEPIQLRFASVDLGVKDDEGREVTSAVLDRTAFTPPGDPPKSKGGRPAGTSKHLQAALETLQRLHAKAVRNVTKDGRDPSEARISVEAWRDTCMGQGMHRNRFGESMAQLKAIGKVRFDYGFAYPLEDQ